MPAARHAHAAVGTLSCGGGTRVTAWPTMEQVEAADAEQLLRWNRFLPTPPDDERLAIINRVFERMCAERDRIVAEDPHAWPQISKRVGLG